MSSPPFTSRLLHWAGLLTWAVVGYPRASELAAEPARLAAPGSLVWLVAFLGFGVAYWLNSREEGGDRVSFLGAQTVAALGVLATSHFGFEGALLAIVAGQAPVLLPSRAAVLWLVGQHLLCLGVYLVIFPPVRAVLTTAIFAGFVAFAFAVSFIQQREAEARRELARLHTELKAAQVLLADREREQERLRIAREVHDSLGHHLTALSLNLEAAVHTVQGPGAEHVRRAQSVARTLLSEVREVVSSLREAPARLGPALHSLARDVPGLTVHLQVPEALSVEDPAVAQSVFRCVQEILTNTLRHASARNLWIEVAATGDGGIQVHARDDGRGATELKPGAGLSGMRERFTQLGGRVELRPGAGRGMELVAWLPSRGAGA
jgi:signal transduction histidine kinase